MSLREDTLKSLTSSVANSFNELWSFRHEFEQSMFTSYDEAAVKIAMGWDPAFFRISNFLGRLLFPLRRISLAALHSEKRLPNS